MKRSRLGRLTAAAAASVTLIGVVVAGFGEAAGAQPNYPSSATLTTSGPTVFASAPTDQQIANLAITELVAGGVSPGTSGANYVCVSLSGGAAFANTSSQTPSVSSSAGNVGAAAVSGGNLTFPINAASSSAATYTLSNLYVTGPSGGHGPVTASVTENENSSCSASSGTVALTSTASAYGIETFSQDTYGQTPDATAATEFSSQVNCSDATPAKNTAVVATDLDPYDALSAATLEGALSAAGDPTGLLITPQGSAGPDLLNALKSDGVGTVYVVGGQDAVSPSVISTLKSTTATKCSGTTAIATSTSLNVVGPIYGQTADDTAVAIDNQANSITAISATLPAPASSYNDTSGNTVGSWTSGGKTAILVSDTDWSDSMAISGAAYQRGLPVILTPGASLGSQASSELSTLGIKNVLVLGGPLAVQGGVVTTLGADGYAALRIAGADATDSAQLLARYEISSSGLDWGASHHTALLAQGAYWSDALGAAVVSNAEDAPIFLTEGPTQGLGQYTPAGMSAVSSSVYNLQVLGGPDAVPQSEINAALQALAS